MSFAKAHNVGALIKTLRAAANTTGTAGSTGDNTEITGVTIDRLAASNPQSAVFAIPFTTTLAAGKSLIIKSATIEHGDASDMSDAADIITLESSTGTKIATHATGGTVAGCKEYDVDLAVCKRYVRIIFTPDLDATGTDTFALNAVAVLGGMDTNPA